VRTLILHPWMQLIFQKSDVRMSAERGNLEKAIIMSVKTNVIICY